MSTTSFDPRTGRPAATVPETTGEEMARVLAEARAAAAVAAATPPVVRRRWLRAVADALESHRDELAGLADTETALGLPRLTGEVTRAANQLRFYGDVAVEGSFLGLTVDEATGATPRLVRLNQPLGPVAVFGASNFPFAFSVLGNDTGAALAAGCPVVAKAHPAHVGLSVRQCELARAALAAAGAPAGLFAMVNGYEAGVALVRAPEVAAVAFTGSQAGGLALWRLANERDVVIPVYAEMGTVNPVVMTRAAAGDVATVAAGLVGSFTLGNGQFCTKPGLLLAPAGCGAAEAVAAALQEAAPAPVMLTRAIAEAVGAGIESMRDAGARPVATVGGTAGEGWTAPAVVLEADIAALGAGSTLLEECFGAVLLVCEYSSDDELVTALATLQPSLAASLITGGEDDEQAAALVAVLAGKVGRVVLDDWPTGVAFTWAQQHGGPWPATTSSRATSVGAAALDRFVRPVTYQATPERWLPEPARSDNPWRLPRRVDGAWQPAPEEES